MKPHEQQLRDETAAGHAFILVTSSGERVRAYSYDHCSLPPLVDESGVGLRDEERSDFFLVWANGRQYRWVAFSSINIIASEAPI